MRETTEHTSSYYAATANWQTDYPQLGRIEGNTWYAMGYSGHGVAPTHIAGQILADAICGDLE
jgi:glycine/D-amino acid oxidase-like deaminating enzyme